MSRPNIVNDRIERIRNNTATPEELEWAAKVLQKYYNRKNSRYIKTRQQHLHPIDRSRTLVKNSPECYVVYTPETIILVSQDQPVAILAKDGNYYTVRENHLVNNVWVQLITNLQKQHIIKFLAGNKYTKKFDEDTFREVYAKVDLDNPIQIIYTKANKLFWNKEYY